MSRPTASFSHLPLEFQTAIESFLSQFKTRWYRFNLRNCFADARSPADYSPADILAFLNSPAARSPIPSATVFNQRLIALDGLYRYLATYRDAAGAPLLLKDTPTKGIAYRQWSRPGRQQKNAGRAPVVKSDPFADLPPEWQACIQQFLTSVRDISNSESSYRSYRGQLARFFAFRPGDPGTVSKTEVLSFIQSPTNGKRNRGKQASVGTRSFRQCCIASLYKFASEYEVNGGEPLYQRSLPTRGLRYGKPALHVRAMPLEDLKRMFAVIPTDTVMGARDRALLMLLYLSTRRVAEVTRLLWLDIEPSVIRERDGSITQGTRYYYSPKGKSAQRLAATMPPLAMALITRYLLESGRMATIQPHDAVFTSAYPGRGRAGGMQAEAGAQPLTTGTVNHIFRQYCKRAGLSPDYHTHVLRHTGARERYLAGQDIISLRDTLGHSSVDMTLRYVGSMTGAADPTVRLLEAEVGVL